MEERGKVGWCEGKLRRLPCSTLNLEQVPARKVQRLLWLEEPLIKQGTIQ